MSIHLIYALKPIISQTLLVVGYRMMDKNTGHGIYSLWWRNRFANCSEHFKGKVQWCEGMELQIPNSDWDHL